MNIEITLVSNLVVVEPRLPFEPWIGIEASPNKSEADSADQFYFLEFENQIPRKARIIILAFRGIVRIKPHCPIDNPRCVSFQKMHHLRKIILIIGLNQQMKMVVSQKPTIHNATHLMHANLQTGSKQIAKNPLLEKREAIECCRCQKITSATNIQALLAIAME